MVQAFNNLVKVLRDRGVIDHDTPVETKEEAIMYALSYLIEEGV